MNKAVRKVGMTFILSLLFSFSQSHAVLPVFDMGEKEVKKYNKRKVVPVQGMQFRRAIIFRGNIIPVIDIRSALIKRGSQKVKQDNPPFSP